MKIYNTLTRKKDEFKPIEEGKVSMYVCGPTVYDYIHIGNARPMIVFDTVRRYFEYKGYDVNYVSNFTDVDDKIIKKAIEEGVDASVISERYIAEAKKDMEALNVMPATVHPKATEEIDGMIAMISDLIDKGYAYEKNGTVYYKTRSFKEYGKLSKKNIDDLEAGHRDIKVAGADEKEDPLDFVLWKPKKEGEPAWKSPWGEGRPGWHIECSTMVLKNLGETIDIHGGGKDLIFPHHENEIAQSEDLTGKPFAKYWSHCGLIKINGEKMSKSLGNSLSIRDALKKYNYEVIKFVMYSKHYTSDMDLLDKDFALAEKHLYYFYNTIKAMKEFINLYNGNKDGEALEDDISESIIPNFIEVMDDDFNSAAALSNLHSIFKYVNVIMKNAKKNNREKTANTLAKILANVKEVYGILGLFEQEPEKFLTEMKQKYVANLDITEEKIDEMIAKRSEAKKIKDFETADAIRSELDSKGIILNDTVNGTTWNVKALFNID